MQRRKPAFTLLELLVVISILGLLLSILLPSLSAARRRAKASVCISHLKGIGHGFAIYLNENEDKFPPVRIEMSSPTSDVPYINGFGRIAPRWQWFLETDQGPVINTTPFQHQIKSGGYFDDYSFPRTGGGGSGTTMTNDTFTCPTLDDENFKMDIRDGAFGYNYQYLGSTRLGASLDRWDNFPVGLHRIRKPGAAVLVADSRGAGNRHGRHSYTLDPPRLAIERNAVRFGPSSHAFTGDPRSGDLPDGLDPEIYAYSPMEPRHNQRGNVLFVDTHAEAMTLKELGYQVSDGATPDTIPKDTPIPIHDPNSGTNSATNKLWNGDDFDLVGRVSP